MSTDSHLIIEHHGAFGLVTLNRPEALNALNLGMIRGIREVLDAWRDDPAIEAVVFQGAGDRAFCAGGDVKKVYEAGVGIADPVARTALARTYFADEYRMNRELFHYPKPTIAFMNGITMGGGFGVAGACKVRVACEKTLFAMPEVGIGFFPDVGSLYTLTRCPHRAGYWLALTGNTIGAADMMALGLATEYMQADQFAPCLEQMVELSDAAALEQFSARPDRGATALSENYGLIENIFSLNVLDDVILKLSESPENFATGTLKTILSRSPTSVKLTFSYLRKMQGASFDAVTAMDYRLAIRCMQGHEFYEGIRAALIDKDKAPRWAPPSLATVYDDVIENYFAEDIPDLDRV